LFDKTGVVRSAQLSHRQLEVWIKLIYSGLERHGTDQQEAMRRMAELRDQMEAATKTFVSPIVSLALTYLLKEQVEELLGSEKEEISSEILQAVGQLAKQLAVLLEQEGWQRNEISRQMSLISEQLTPLSKAAGILISALTVAVTLDNYATYIVRGNRG
jgi:DNA topoisomerase VI subunit B